MQEKHKITDKHMHSIYMKSLTGFLALQQEKRLISTIIPALYQILGNSSCNLAILAL